MVVKVNNVLLDKLMNCAVVLRRYYFLFAKFKPKEKRRMGSEKLPRCHLKGLLLRAWPILSQSMAYFVSTIFGTTENDRRVDTLTFIVDDLHCIKGD